jgi:hypothetical protein
MLLEDTKSQPKEWNLTVSLSFNGKSKLRKKAEHAEYAGDSGGMRRKGEEIAKLG